MQLFIFFNELIVHTNIVSKEEIRITRVFLVEVYYFVYKTCYAERKGRKRLTNSTGSAFKELMPVAL